MILDLGLIAYEDAYRVQKDLVARRKLGEIGDTLILAEHPSVFTIGRSGSRQSLRVDERQLDREGIKVLSVDRGGDITYHGPGQLVAYPIIDLRRSCGDLHRYLRLLEDVAIGFLNEYGVSAVRVPGKTGVWTAGRKISSIGIGASNWVTYHGISINIDCDLRFFSMIYPCGMKNAQVDSLGRILGRAVSVDDAKKVFVAVFNRIMPCEEIPSGQIRAAQLA